MIVDTFRFMRSAPRPWRAAFHWIAARVDDRSGNGRRAMSPGIHVRMKRFPAILLHFGRKTR
jgi:hypothetical protein